MRRQWEVHSSAKSIYLRSNHSHQHYQLWKGLFNVLKYTTSMVILIGSMTLTNHHPKLKRWKSLFRVKLTMNSHSAIFINRDVRWITYMFHQSSLLWVETLSAPKCSNQKSYLHLSTSAKRVKMKVKTQITPLSRPIRSNSALSRTSTRIMAILVCKKHAIIR